MGWNYSSVEYLEGQLYIRHEAARRFWRERQDDIPEGSPYDSIDLIDPPDDGWHEVNPDWTGEGSGSRSEAFRDFLRLTVGSADILMHSDYGVEGVRVVNGDIVPVRTEIVLVPVDGERPKAHPPTTRLDLLGMG